MRKRYLTIIGLVASFAIGFYVNTILAKKSTSDNTEITKSKKHEIRSIFNQS